MDIEGVLKNIKRRIKDGFKSLNRKEFIELCRN